MRRFDQNPHPHEAESRSISAYAEVCLCRRCRNCRSPVHLRICGGLFRAMACSTLSKGPSPHMRRFVFERKRRLLRAGSISAYAEVWEQWPDLPDLDGVHLRICGGLFAFRIAFSRELGPSPHMRRFARLRGIGRRRAPVHLRICGGLDDMAAGVRRKMGPSPHMRRFAVLRRDQIQVVGSISAYAEVWTTRGPRMSPNWVHLRICGGLRVRAPARVPRSGPSPHMRRFGALSRSRRPYPGSISAYAEVCSPKLCPTV